MNKRYIAIFGVLMLLQSTPVFTKLHALTPAAQSDSEYYPVDFVFFDQRLIDSLSDPMPAPHEDSMLRAAQQHLPKQMAFTQLPSARIREALESNRPTCSPAKLKTPERENQFLFSKLTRLTLSARLFSAKPLEQTMLERDQSVAQLMDLTRHNETFKIFYSPERSFGSVIDEQLDSLPKRHKYQLNNQAFFGREVDLFLRGRSDFLIETPIVLFIQDSEKAQSLYSYQIKANNSYMAGYVMCNDFPETRAFLADLDGVLEKLYEEGVLLDIHLKIHPKQFHQEIGDYVEAILSTK